jgi:peroxiredoxin
MIKKTILILLIFIASYVINAQNEVIIKGKIINNKDFRFAYLENIMAKSDLDSCALDSTGKFMLKAKIVKSDFYKLRFSQESYILLVLNAGENVDVEVDESNFFQPVIKGSKNSELVYSTYGKLKDYDMELQALTKQYEQKKKDYIRQFILNNMNSLATLFFIDNLSIDDDGKIYQSLDDSLSRLYPGHSLVDNLHQRVKSTFALAIGNEAPEIDLPGLNGKNIKLSSFRGKYVLIDFWAAWCEPCRGESPKMVTLYKEFRKKGFEIYSVSLDNNKKDWENAIKKDGLSSWTHVSDLKYWSCEAVKKYSVDAIPYTVLIDKEGKIIAKGLRGDDLQTKLKEIFK